MTPQPTMAVVPAGIASPAGKRNRVVSGAPPAVGDGSPGSGIKGGKTTVATAGGPVINKDPHPPTTAPPLASPSP